MQKYSFLTQAHCTGGTQFSLENIGYGTCASAYESGFVMIGGRGGTPTSQHGKVDRCIQENYFCGNLLSDPGMTLRVTTLAPFLI